jgi:hypothetical protein
VTSALKASVNVPDSDVITDGDAICDSGTDGDIISNSDVIAGVGIAFSDVKYERRLFIQLGEVYVNYFKNKVSMENNFCKHVILKIFVFLLPDNFSQPAANPNM